MRQIWKTMFPLKSITYQRRKETFEGQIGDLNKQIKELTEKNTQFSEEIESLMGQVEAYETEKATNELKVALGEVIEQFTVKFKGYEDKFNEITENAVEKYESADELKNKLIFALGEIAFQQEIEEEEKPGTKFHFLPKENDKDEQKSPYGNLKPIE